jgi:hypothetical protein
MPFSAVYSCMIALLNPALILPMDSRLMPRTRAKVDVAQTHRFPKFLPSPFRSQGTGRLLRHANTQRNVFPGRWGLVRLLTLASVHPAQDIGAICAKLRGVKLLLATIFLAATAHSADTDTQTLRVFIFAGQSNMVGTHSRVKDINRFPPFAGAGSAAEGCFVLLQARAGEHGDFGGLDSDAADA